MSFLSRLFGKKKEEPAPPAAVECPSTLLTVELDEEGMLNVNFFFPDVFDDEEAGVVSDRAATMLFLLSSGAFDHLLQEAIVHGGDISGLPVLSRLTLNKFNAMTAERARMTPDPDKPVVRPTDVFRLQLPGVHS